jgi:hypothetical protein
MLFIRNSLNKVGRFMNFFFIEFIYNNNIDKKLKKKKFNLSKKDLRQEFHLHQQ